MITRPIGERFQYDGVTLEVKENKSCKGCFFYSSYRCKVPDEIERCEIEHRTDHKSVIFVEVKPMPEESEQMEYKMNENMIYQDTGRVKIYPDSVYPENVGYVSVIYDRIKKNHFTHDTVEGPALFSCDMTNEQLALATIIMRAEKALAYSLTSNNPIGEPL